MKVVLVAACGPMILNPSLLPLTCGPVDFLGHKKNRERQMRFLDLGSLKHFMVCINGPIDFFFNLKIKKR